MENKNFMDDFSKKNSGKKNFEENLILDKKIKLTKSNYDVQDFKKDFERILGYKKIISHKNKFSYFRLYFM